MLIKTKKYIRDHLQYPPQFLRNTVKKLIGRWRAARLAEALEDIRLDLGCGATSRNGFIGIDMNTQADLQWDVRWGLPFASATASEIRSDHFFEHLTLKEVVETFRECRRVMKPGAILDFTIPHFDPYLDAYIRRDLGFLQSKINDVPVGDEYLYNKSFDLISWLLHRQGEHKSMFDRDSIIAKLEVAGFTDVKTRQFDPQRDTNCRYSSVYVVAIK